ncbi:helix-turn-helix domain-containing protein [Aerococcaceae bacterium NML201209]|nr:helix-turn-helix domain-containing protein [Aerococcaceae bacterium NML201209]
MNILGHAIKTLRKSKGLTQQDLAQLTGFKQNTISNHENGNRTLDEVDIETYARALNVKPQELFDLSRNNIHTSSTLSLITETSAKLNDDNQLNVLNYATNLYEDQQNSVKESLRLYTVEVVEGLAAGNGFSYGDNETTIYYTDREDLRYYDEASLVVGDSMEPDYPDGSIALIQRGYDSLNGQVYAVDYDGKSFIKKVYNEQSHFRLVSINEKYEDIIIDVPVHEDTHFNIIGKVVDWFMPVER